MVLSPPFSMKGQTAYITSMPLEKRCKCIKLFEKHRTNRLIFIDSLNCFTKYLSY